MKLVTIWFSIHRAEIIGITADLIQRHDVISQEEPPAEGFMLQGDLSIDDYLWHAEGEYPELIHCMFRLLWKLYQNGKEIIQVAQFL